jgi:hypothetical protein
MLVLVLLIGSIGQASEVRMISTVPSSGKTTALALVKSKKAGFQCQKVKIGENGNPTKVKNSKSYWFEESAIKEDAGAENLLDSGKPAYRCTLKQYDKDRSRMRNADIGDES